MIKTAEAVSIGHPDKVCDQISDAILDACLKQDSHTRAAIETMGGHGVITVTGELTTNAHVNLRDVIEKTYKECGYKNPIGIVTNIVKQSNEIKRGVDNDGAGDQGIMVGYATNETKELMPLEVVLARKLVRAMGARDGKSQVTVENGKVQSFITSVCNPTAETNRNLEQVVKKEIKPHLAKGKTIANSWLRNPNGKWTVGGFEADTGLTGRKIIVDAYGPGIPAGGGAFSGKDATKVDRSGAYMARKVAVDYLKKRKAKEVFVHIAYAIGVPEPTMAVVTLDGKQENITGYDLRPKAIIKLLGLQKPIFRETAKYGHFGNGFKWDF